jgi:broad specificity phosphatase PhoE
MRGMGTLYLVRHGQASFGADDYDQLSPRGMEQAECLGQYWQERGQPFDAVFTGTLRRHAQTLEGIARQLPGLPAAEALPALNRIRQPRADPLHPPRTAGQGRHPRALPPPFPPAVRCTGPVDERCHHPAGMPSWDDFSAGIRSTLERIRQQHAGGNVLVVSSGGPISAAVAQVLGTTPEASIALNMRIRNSAVTEFSISPKRMMLQTFNTLNHLDTPQTRDWATFA